MRVSIVRSERRSRRGGCGSNRQRAAAGPRRPACRSAVPWESTCGKKRRLMIRRQEHGERPAAGTLSDQLLRELVDLVEIGPLLAIHLDVDEQLIHQCG